MIEENPKFMMRAKTVTQTEMRTHNDKAAGDQGEGTVCTSYNLGKHIPHGGKCFRNKGAKPFPSSPPPAKLTVMGKEDDTNGQKKRKWSLGCCEGGE